jgi:hypothetical protein
MHDPDGRADTTRASPPAPHRRSLPPWDQLAESGPAAEPGGPVRANSDLPRPVPELVQFWFDDVAWLEWPRGLPPGAEHLGLYVDDRGMELSGPVRTRRVPWIRVTAVELGPAEVVADGRMMRPLDVVTVDERFRLLLPTTAGQSVLVDALEERLPGWSAATVDGAASPVLFPVGPDRQPLDGPVVPGSYGPAVTPLWSPEPSWAEPPRVRRWATLVGGIVLVLAAVGLAFALSGMTAHHRAASPTTRSGAGTSPPPSANPDQLLAQRMVLTQADVPSGWTIDNENSNSGTSPGLQAGEAHITTALATCMGITAEQANVVLGGEASDQTAQATSPIFVAPPSDADPGFTLQLQTAANVVRTSVDQVRDFSLLDNPRYPDCEATAVASELQLGADHASGTTGRSGPATVTALHLVAPAGERVSALLSSFTVTDRGATVPVEVEIVSLGSDRIEANLQAFAIGGGIPAGILESPVTTLEHRVATTTSAISV